MSPPMGRLRFTTSSGCAARALFLVFGCTSGAAPTVPSAGGPQAGHEAFDAAVALDAAINDPRFDAATPFDGGAMDAGALHDAAAPDAMVAEPPAVIAPDALTPSYLGILVGPGMSEPQPGLRLYGTDLGISFEHLGDLQMLFGDTWAHDEQVCGDAPLNDDTLALLPVALASGELPSRSSSPIRCARSRRSRSSCCATTSR